MAYASSLAYLPSTIPNSPNRGHWHRFVRVLAGKKNCLFRRLRTGPGMVVRKAGNEAAATRPARRNEMNTKTYTIRQPFISVISLALLVFASSIRAAPYEVWAGFPRVPGAVELESGQVDEPSWGRTNAIGRARSSRPCAQPT